MYQLTTNHLCEIDVVIYPTNVIPYVRLLVPDLTNQTSLREELTYVHKLAQNKPTRKAAINLLD